MINKVLRYAKIYYNIVKEADLKQNMAIRILHSLIPVLVGDLENPEKVQKFLASDLIPGAKEIFEYGTKAVSNEYSLSKNLKSKEKIQHLISIGDYKSALSLAATGFLNDFEGATGGQPWSTFANALITLSNQIEITEKTKNPDEALKLSTYLNTIDGLAHNTSDFIEKLVQQESGYLNPEKVEELRKMRDITRLPSEQVITLMRQYIKDPIYKNYIKEYVRLHPMQEGNYEQAIKNLQEFQIQRKLEKVVDNELEPVKIKHKTTPKPPRPKH
jgi:hypothetical protein